MELSHKRFDEVFDLQLGRTPARGVDKYWGGTNTWVSIADMGQSKFISSSKECISDTALAETGIPLVPKNVVIMSFKLSIGKVAITKRELYTNEAIMAFLPKPGTKILNDYLYYYLQGYKWDNSNNVVLGFTLNKKSISSSVISYPSLSEQQRIVDILDREFAKIDALKANAEKSLQAAKDLFQATLKKELEPREGWKKACLDDVCNIVGRIGFRGYTRNDIVPSPDDGAISLSPSNIVDGEMRYDKLTYISWFKYDESPEIKIFNGDILLVKTGSSYGKSAIIKDLPHEATINPQLVVLKNIKIDTQYLHFFLSTDNAKKKFDEFVSGTAIPTFSQRNLGQMEICFPNPETTLGIISKLNNLRKRLTSFQENYQKTLTLCDDLKQSLLRKAFNGEL